MFARFWHRLTWRRPGSTGEAAPLAISVPHLLDDPREALLLQQGGEVAAFRCPLHALTHFLGFDLSKQGWHPFVETLHEFRLQLASRFEDSILHDYYEAWQPATAADALAGFAMKNSALSRLPPHYFYLTPWTAATPEGVMESVSWWSTLENEEHGDASLDFATHGLGYYGPTHPAKGRLEYHRLIRIFDRLRSDGYDRTRGDVVVRILERSGEFRFLIDGGGYHRAAAAAALGHIDVPAVLREPFTIRAEDADYWPQVRRGVWDRDDAIRYFHHLFDFDSRAWARAGGMLLEQKYPQLGPTFTTLHQEA